MDVLINYFNSHIFDRIETFSNNRINLLEESRDLEIITNLRSSEQTTTQPSNLQQQATSLSQQLSSIFGINFNEAPQQENVRIDTNNNFDQTFVITTIMTNNLPHGNVQITRTLHDGNYLSNILTNILSNFIVGNNSEDVILPMTEDAINKLEVKKYVEIIDPNKSDECTICRENFDDTCSVTILPCKHIFHKDCIEEWLKNYHHKCPVCRQDCGEYKPQM